MNKKLIELELRKYQLKQRVQYLIEYRNNLDQMVTNIVTSKAFIWWQRFLKIKEKFGIRSFAKLIGTPLRWVKSRIPYSTRIRLKKIISKLDSSYKEFETFKNVLDQNPITTDERTPIDETVSVVIPTMNAGLDFEVVIKKIVCQKGVPSLEVIIADSGSIDQTVDIAEQYGVKVIRIKKEEFSHSKTRNQAAKLATGKYLIFTVQDAYMMSEYTVYDLVNLLKTSRAAAGSGRQVPRADADLFASWQISEFVNMISPDQKNMVVAVNKKTFVKLPLEKQRALCTIDDVLSIYETETFRTMGGYDESLGYGEDLEMGKRLIENGYKIAFLFSNGVIHSHSRPAAYVLKRYYTDSKFLYQVFKTTPAAPAHSKLSLEKYLTHFLYLGIYLERKVQTIEEFSEAVLTEPDLSQESVSIEPKFTSTLLIKDLMHTLNFSSDFEKIQPSVLLQMSDQFNYFIKYAQPFMDRYFNFEAKHNPAIIDLFDKIFAVYVSNQLAQYALQHQADTKVRQQLDSFLESGV
jgi:glycosyltransferase involved in cell wall biosynthesis